MSSIETKSLRERDRHIADNWYIACLSQELKNKPLARMIYDVSYVLFRDETGKAACVINRCLHRLTQMDQGKVVDGRLVCPYHGWTYNAKGEVVFIPSEGPKQNEKRNLRAKTLPCAEQDGAVWVYTGEGPPAQEKPPWRFPRAQDPEWTSYFMITDFNNEVTNLCENFMDVPHTVFVHKGWFRNQSFKKVPMTVTTKNGRVLVRYDQEKDRIGGAFHWLLNPKGEPMEHTDEFIYPNITRVDYTFGERHGFIINSQNTPVSTLNSRVYTYIAYRIAAGNKLVKPFIRYYTRKVIEQDVDIMEIQAKSLRLDPTENFRSTDADALHVAIERLRRYGQTGNPKLYEFEDEIKKEFWI